MTTAQEIRSLPDVLFDPYSEAWGAAYPTVESRRDLSYEEFVRDHVKGNRPVVIKGAIDQDAITPRVLREFCGHKPLSQFIGGGGSTVLVRGRQSAIENFKTLTTFGEYLDHFEDPAADLPYLTNLDITRNFGEIIDRFTPPPYLQPNWMNQWSLTNYNGAEVFIAPVRAAYGILHFDRHRVFLGTCQYYGRKIWWLCPPDQGKYLYLAKEVDYPHISLVNPFEPDLERFPLFANVKPFVVTLEAGDVMYVPSSWWHVTKAITPNIATVHRIINRHNILPYLWDQRRFLARHPYLIANGFRRMLTGR